MSKVLGQRSNKRWCWLIGLEAALVVLYPVADGGHWLRLSTIKAHQAELEAWRAAQPVTAALLYFAGCGVVTALLLPGAKVMTLAAGALVMLAALPWLLCAQQGADPQRSPGAADARRGHRAGGR